MKNKLKPKPINSIVPLWRELKKRLSAPTGQVSFWVFLFIGVILFSACGVWVEVGKYYLSSTNDLDGVRTAIYTFFPALACTATMQIIFSENDTMKHLRSAAYAVGLILILIAIALLALGKHVSPTVSISWGIFASAVSILTWWVANGQDQIFYDNITDLSVPLGGDPELPLSGNTLGFKVK